MPPRFQPTQTTNQRPLHNEILTLHKILGNDILEQAARILDHFATTKENQLQAPYSETPPQLTHKLVEKSEEFETVCDQIYYILEQSKRVLQLDYQQKIIQQKELENQHQMEKMDNEPHDPMQVDQEMEFGTTQLDLSMDDEQVDTNKQKPVTIDEEDMEELLHIQRDRLDRLKNVIVFGMDADAAKANGSDEKIEDLLF